jgi:ATP-dependent RNA helicase DDX55/SPB4
MTSSDGRKKNFSRQWGALTPPLADWILEAITAWGFRSMTPVQAAVIPLFCQNKDVVVEVSSGPVFIEAAHADQFCAPGCDR